MSRKDPQLNEDLFEGDMKLTPEQVSLAAQYKLVNDVHFLWPEDSDGNVPVPYRYGSKCTT